MSGEEFKAFEAELQRLKPGRPPEELLQRLTVAAPKRHREEHARVGQVAQIFNLLYRRFLTCWRHDSTGCGADYKSAIQQSPGGRPPNLRYGARVFRWVVPGAVAVAIGMSLWMRQATERGNARRQQPVAQANPALKADKVELDRQLVSSFDAVARLPGGEPVRFRCREWVDEVVLRDSRRGLVIEQRTPHLEVVPVGFETY